MVPYLPLLQPIYGTYAAGLRSFSNSYLAANKLDAMEISHV